MLYVLELPKLIGGSLEKEGNSTLSFPSGGTNLDGGRRRTLRHRQQQHERHHAHRLGLGQSSRGTPDHRGK
jgi:hypothetical protein